MSILRFHARASIAAISVLVVGCLGLGRAAAQHDMSSMPGMAPAPKSTASAASPKTKPARSKQEKHDMSAMPGMAPARNRTTATTTPEAKSTGTASTQHGMEGMSGMSHGERGAMKRSQTMPGMAAKDGTGMQRMAVPGVRVLAPPQKWAPPPGDNRAGELLSRSMLYEHLKGLPSPVVDNLIHSFFLTELFEYRANSDGQDTFRWDVYGWIGGDYNRIWIKSEGSQQLEGNKTGEGDLQLLYGRLIAPFWDFQVGARVQQNLGTGSSDSRTYAAIGVQGIAPYLFDVEPTLFISDRGDVSTRITVSFDLLLTQKLVLQPRFEMNAAFQSDEKLGVGEGVNDTEIGLRLRYEIWREFAPYIGVSWLHRYGETARLAEAEGDAADIVSFVAGLRMWF